MGNAVLGQTACHTGDHNQKKASNESIKRQARTARIAKRGMLSPTRV